MPADRRPAAQAYLEVVDHRQHHPGRAAREHYFAGLHDARADRSAVLVVRAVGDREPSRKAGRGGARDTQHAHQVACRMHGGQLVAPDAHQPHQAFVPVTGGDAEELGDAGIHRIHAQVAGEASADEVVDEEVVARGRVKLGAVVSEPADVLERQRALQRPAGRRTDELGPDLRLHRLGLFTGPRIHPTDGVAKRCAGSIDWDRRAALR
jgi:hypothetical protein